MPDFTFRIKRFDPERTPREWWAGYGVSMEPGERVLDGLVRIKDTLDGSLTFRRSCAHGICGSCAMRIAGTNALACQTLMKDMPRTVEIEPLPALPVVRDLVVDMESFFARNEAVMPYLVNDEPPPPRERLQSPEEQKRIAEAITCVMCAGCTSACPTAWADGEYPGPSALLKAYRFIFDSRDRAGRERLARVAGEHGVWRCHSIYECVEVCPKGIDIARHLAALKRAALKRRLQFRR
jgi:succinate dehydrogenase / fumarate reductase iron-sulfur subunit